MGLLVVLVVSEVMSLKEKGKERSKSSFLESIGVDASKTRKTHVSPCAGRPFGADDEGLPLPRSNLIGIVKTLDTSKGDPETPVWSVSWPWKSDDEKSVEVDVTAVSNFHWVAFSAQQLQHLSFYGCYNGTLARAIKDQSQKQTKEEAEAENNKKTKANESSKPTGASDFTPVVIAQFGQAISSSFDQKNLPCAVVLSESLQKHFGVKDGDRIQLSLLTNVVQSSIPTIPKVRSISDGPSYNVYCKEKSKDLPREKLHSLHKPKTLHLPVTAYVDAITSDLRHRIYLTHAQLSNMGVETPFPDWRLEAFSQETQEEKVVQETEQDHKEQESSLDGVVITGFQSDGEPKPKPVPKRLGVDGVQTYLWVEGSEDAQTVLDQMESSGQMKRRKSFYWEEEGGGVVISKSVAKALNLKQGDYLILVENQNPQMRLMQKALNHRGQTFYLH